MINLKELPIGFGMALAQNEAAMERFAALSSAEKELLLSQARDAQSKWEMRQLVAELTKEA